MLNLMRDFWADEGGFLISMELVLIATIGVLGLIVGLSCLTNALVAEYQDLGWAVRSLNQSYYFGGFRGCKSFFPGSSYVNRGVNQNLPVNTDTNWDIGIGTTVVPYAPSTVVTPGVQAAPTVVCPPLSSGPAIIQPDGTVIQESGPIPSTVVPCPDADCATAPSSVTVPLKPIPDHNVPGAHVPAHAAPGPYVPVPAVPAQPVGPPQPRH